MMADCRAGKVDRILVKSMSRFARNTSDFLLAMRELTRLGVTIRFEKENIDTGKLTSEQTATIYAGFAQMESTNHSSNMRTSVRMRMERGIFTPSSMPYGYRLNGLEPEIVLEEAEVVRYIFGQYLAGASLLAIAEDMTRQGPRYHQHTPAWNKNMVKRVLENARYTGAEGYPPLVPDEKFTAVRRQRSSRNTYAPLSDEVRSILGKLVCAECGGRLARGTRSHGRVHWRCQDCGQSVSISDEALAEMVSGRLRELSQAPHLLTAPEPQQTEPNLEAVRLQNELTLALNRGGESPEYIKSLILATAAPRYNQIPDPTPAHELERLRVRLEQGPADAYTLSTLLAAAVRAVRLAPDKTVTLELVNSTVITEKKEVQSA